MLRQRLLDSLVAFRYHNRDLCSLSQGRNHTNSIYLFFHLDCEFIILVYPVIRSTPLLGNSFIFFIDFDRLRSEVMSFVAYS